MHFRFSSLDSAARGSWVVVVLIGLTTLLAPASYAGPGPTEDYCEIDIKCSVSGYELRDDGCFADETQEITFHYDFIGGTAEIIDDRFGVIGIYTGNTLTRTAPLGSYGTHTATFRPIEAVCLWGVFSDSVWAAHAQPTPTSSPTATPTATPTPTATATPTSLPPNSCAAIWPVANVVTTAKGQSPTNNPKVVHRITGNIVDPGSLGDTAHRIPVCAGTEVFAVVTDTTGTPTNTANGSLSCDSGGCSGVIDATEKYQSVSQDGQDKDRITFIPN